MTPEEKARELVDKYMDITPADYSFNDTVEQTNQKAIADLKLCKQCALIAVDEILNQYWMHNLEMRDWWQSVKSEIEKL